MSDKVKRYYFGNVPTECVAASAYDAVVKERDEALRRASFSGSSDEQVYQARHDERVMREAYRDAGNRLVKVEKERDALKATVEAAKVIRDWADEAVGVDKDGRLVAQYDECGDPEGWPTRLRDAITAFDAALAPQGEGCCTLNCVTKGIHSGTKCRANQRGTTGFDGRGRRSADLSNVDWCPASLDRRKSTRRGGRGV